MSDRIRPLRRWPQKGAEAPKSSAVGKLKSRLGSQRSQRQLAGDKARRETTDELYHTPSTLRGDVYDLRAAPASFTPRRSERKVVAPRHSADAESQDDSRDEAELRQHLEAPRRTRNSTRLSAPGAHNESEERTSQAGAANANEADAGSEAEADSEEADSEEVQLTVIKRGRGPPRKSAPIPRTDEEPRKSKSGQASAREDTSKLSRPVGVGAVSDAALDHVQSASGRRGRGKPKKSIADRRNAYLPSDTHQASGKGENSHVPFTPTNEELSDETTSSKRKTATPMNSAAKRLHMSKTTKDANVKGIAEASTIPLHIEKIRAEELGYSPMRDDEPGVPSSKSPQMTPPGASPESNEQRSQVQITNANRHSTEDSSSGRLYGQWPALIRVFSAVRGVGGGIKGGKLLAPLLPDLFDEEVKRTVKLCKQAMLCYEGLADDSETDEPTALMSKIDERVHGLEDEKKFMDTDKSTAIYSHLIPSLVELLRLRIAYYESMDIKSSAKGQLTRGNLDIVTSMIFVIVTLGKTARKYARPSPNDRVVRSVQNPIIAPLAKIHTALTKELRYQEEHELYVEQSKRVAEERALRLQQDELRWRRDERVRILRRRWECLHEERRLAEGGWPSLAKIEHLRIPDTSLDIDQNGEAFYRVEMFRPRVGPSPGLVDAARAHVWAVHELAALESGLREYAGPHVYERIIRRYCLPSQPLHRFNVTEIVTTAADLRKFLLQRLGPEEWIRDLYVWTAKHGNDDENEDGLEAT